MDTPEHVWFLMARNLGGEASPEEQEELMKLLQQNPQWMQHYDMMKTLWKPAADKQEAGDDPARIRHILQLAAEESGESPVIPIRKNRLRLLFTGAAAAAVVVAILWSVVHLAGGGNTPAHPGQQEIVAQKGSKTRTLLPDGSTVWLNAGSKITYPSSFNGAVREVTLQGEAFFDVVKQPDRPFIVHAADIDIKVLGTAFNVKSYDEDKTVETTLIRGLVQITRQNDRGKQPILLQPNQKLVLNKAGQPGGGEQEASMSAITDKISAAQIQLLDSTKKENEQVETAWVYNRLEFRGEHFEELAFRLDRWYNINIHFEDEAVKKLTFTGSVETETVEQAFLALKAAAQFRYEIRENEIYIRSLQ
jgi:transmembrane sensor